MCATLPLHFAFIGPGGPEFLVVMLVLLMMFGAKDAPRILRKLNEIFNQFRNTADGFKREVMYGDLNHDKSTYEPPENTDESSFDEDYYDYGDDDGGDGEEFNSFEDGPKDDPSPEEAVAVDPSPDEASQDNAVADAPEPDLAVEDSPDEDGHAQKN